MSTPIKPKTRSASKKRRVDDEPAEPSTPPSTPALEPGPQEPPPVNPKQGGYRLRLNIAENPRPRFVIDDRPGFNDFIPRRAPLEAAVLRAQVREEIKAELLNDTTFMMGIRQEALAIVLDQQATSLHEAARRLRIPK